MTLFRASHRYQVALIALLGYLVLLLHPVLSHAGLFGGMLDNFASQKSHDVTIQASSDISDDCALCHMAGSLTPGTAITSPCIDFHFAEPPFFVHSFGRALSTIPGLRLPRAPPMMG